MVIEILDSHVWVTVGSICTDVRVRVRVRVRDMHRRLFGQVLNSGTRGPEHMFTLALNIYDPVHPVLVFLN